LEAYWNFLKHFGWYFPSAAIKSLIPADQILRDSKFCHSF